MYTSTHVSTIVNVSFSRYIIIVHIYVYSTHTRGQKSIYLLCLIQKYGILCLTIELLYKLYVIVSENCVVVIVVFCLYDLRDRRRRRRRVGSSDGRARTSLELSAGAPPTTLTVLRARRETETETTLGTIFFRPWKTSAGFLRTVTSGFVRNAETRTRIARFGHSRLSDRESPRFNRFVPRSPASSERRLFVELWSFRERRRRKTRAARVRRTHIPFNLIPRHDKIIALLTLSRRAVFSLSLSLT